MGGRGSYSSTKEKFFDWLSNEYSGQKTPHPMDIDEFQGMSLEQIEERIRSLNHEELFFINKDGKVLKAYKGDSHSVAFPSSDLELNNVTVTHGHPKSVSGFGGTFSLADMNNMTRSNWQEHRAAARGQGEMNYIMRRTANANPSGLRAKINRDIPNLKNSMSKTYDRAYTNALSSGKSKSSALHEARQKSVGELNSYYKRTLSAYGYEYVTRKKSYGYNR